MHPPHVYLPMSLDLTFRNETIAAMQWWRANDWRRWRS